MSTILQQFSSNPRHTKFRELSVGVTGTISQMPTGSISLFRMKANGNNGGQLFITNGGTDHSFPLSAGDDTGWIPGTQLNEYFYFGDTLDDKLHIWIQN